MINRLEYRLKPLGDFVNVHGKLVHLYGCSYIDLEEFVHRVDKIRHIVQHAEVDEDSEQLSFDWLMSDSVFRQHVARCLELHGLSLEDVSLRHIQSLLLYEVVDQQLQPGLLVRINTPRSSTEVANAATVELGGDPAKDGYEKALAIIATHTKSVSEAVELTKQMSVQQLADYLAESTDIQRQISQATAEASAGGSMLAKADREALLQQLDKYC
jgi:hypothetical protein